mgnify:CR=1 FL=1
MFAVNRSFTREPFDPRLTSKRGTKAQRHTTVRNAGWVRWFELSVPSKGAAKWSYTPALYPNFTLNKN